MAITNEMRTAVTELYVSLFGRAPESAGLAYWVVELHNGASLKDIAQRMYEVTPARNYYPAGVTSDEIVAKFYQNVLGRVADEQGLKFWTAEMNKPGSTPGSVLVDMINAVNAYAGSDADGLRSQALFKNKVAVGFYYGFEVAGNDTVAAANILAGVTEQDASVKAAKVAYPTAAELKAAAEAKAAADAAAAAAAAATPKTFALTVGNDSFTGNVGNDTFNGVAGTGATLGAADILDGAGGAADILNISTNANFSIDGTKVTNIEKLSITNNAAASRTVTLTGVAGLTDVINNASTSGSNLVFSGLAAPVNVTVQNTTTSTTVQTSGTAGGSDTVALTLSGAGSTTTSAAVTVAATIATTNEYERLNITSGGGAANYITLTTDSTQTSLADINITGSAGLVMRLAADNIRTSALTINASTTTGGVTIGGDGVNNTLGAANHTVTLGGGNDSVYFGANLSAGDTVAGGANTDTLGVSSAITNAAMTNVTGFEVVRFDLSAGAITQDAGISSLIGFKYAVSGNNTLTLNNLANAASVTVAGNTTTLIQAMADSSGASDSLTLTMGADIVNPTLTTLSNVTGLETLNIVSTGGTGTNTIATNSVTAAQVVTGSSNLTITNALVTSSFDASALTGNLNVKGQAAVATDIKGGTGADTIAGGTAADTLSGGAGNDNISGGGGDDVITGGLGADTLAGGTGADVFVYAGNEVVATGMDHITDFDKTVDKIRVSLSGANIDASVFQARNGTGSFDWTTQKAGNIFVDEWTGTSTDYVFIFTQNSSGGNAEAIYINVGNIGVTASLFEFNVTGTGGADNLKGGVVNDTIDGGAGNDAITGGAGVDKMTGGTGVDTFNIAAGDAVISGTAVDTITDLALGVGGDVIRFNGGATAATAATFKTLSAGGQTNVSGAASLTLAATQAIVETGDEAKSVVIFTYGTDTYLLYNNATTSNSFSAAEDALIKITGVTGTLAVENIFVA